jgi:hypothetical protein
MTALHQKELQRELREDPHDRLRDLHKPMRGPEFNSAIEKLGMSRVGVARFIGIDERTPRRWIKGTHPVPVPVAILLRMMIRFNIPLDNVLSPE